jgi:hypothetical protein
MKKSEHFRWTRRDFLSVAPAVLAGSLLAERAGAEERPAVTNPRATAGDAVEPKWDSRLTITVGPQKADLVGADEKAIQAGVDYIAAEGGGTLHILPGTYRLRNAVSLRTGVRILGSGPDSVLVKAPQVKSKLAADSESWEQEVTLADASGFQVGDGVCLRVDNVWHQGHFIIRRSLIARSGNRFKLDQPLNDDDFTLKGQANISTLFPLLCGDGIADAVIEDITLDGNKANQESLDHFWGNFLACIWLNRSNRINIRNVTSRESAADGISWQTSHDALIEDCHCHDNAGFGLHAGSGSQRPLVQRNKLERNYIGFYFCWGVRYGRVENNMILDSQDFGVHFGHKDTDNVVRGNEIRRSGKVGVICREVEDDGDLCGEGGYCPDRNRLEDNHIVDSGPEDGIGIDVQGRTDAIAISHNDLRETRQPLKRIGVRIGARAGKVQLDENRIEGFALNVSDLRGPSAKVINKPAFLSTGLEERG